MFMYMAWKSKIAHCVLYAKFRWFYLAPVETSTRIFWLTVSDFEYASSNAAPLDDDVTKHVAPPRHKRSAIALHRSQ